MTESDRPNKSIRCRADIGRADRQALIDLLEGEFCVGCAELLTLTALREAAYDAWNIEYGKSRS